MGVSHSAVADRGASLASFDLADHPVPTGREEAWRFTPLRRLRGLHDGSAEPSSDAVTVTVDAAPGVLVESVGRDDPRLGLLGAPDDRVEAQVNASFSTATVVTVGPEVSATTPTTIRVHGNAETAGVTRLLVQVAARGRSRRHRRPHGDRRSGGDPGGPAGRRRATDAGVHPGLGCRSGPRCPPTVCGRPERDPAGHQRNPRRRHRPDLSVCDLRRSRR